MECDMAEDVQKLAGAHIPVMHQEVLEYLNPSAGATVVDCTVGLAGHSCLLANRIGPTGHLIGIDRDAGALKEAKHNLSGFQGRLDLRQGDFRRVDSILDDLNVPVVDAFLLDLGISSFQLDNPERGFSFRLDGPLDMRMDQDNPVSAFDLVNHLPEEQLAKILWEFGDERFSRRIAKFIVQSRHESPIETTHQLSAIVMRAMPRVFGRQQIHPATRTFQALRIAVNVELESLQEVLDKCIGRLKPSGRIAVIAFHSLEDRIVKNKFRDHSKIKTLALLTKKPLRPALEESEANPRARSARLRVAEKIQ